MKKNILLLMALATQINFAQSVFPTDGGNVGIGTTIPSDKLTVVGSTQIESNITLGHIGNTNRIGSREVDQTLTIAGSGITTFDTYLNGWFERMRITNNGNVGIGTASPSDKLTVVGSTQIESNITLGHVGNTNRIGSREVDQTLTIAGSGMTTFDTYLNGWFERMRITNNGNVGIGTVNPQQKFVVSNNGAEGFELYLDQSSSIVGLQSYNRVLNSYSKMQLDASQFSFMYGNVGIGKVNPQNKLDVNGTIHSQEVKVDMLGWSDFVFKKEYTLPTLEEVEKQINEKGHLENIPSEEEVLKNGINLGEMNAKLLQKIEELTLYAIEQQKNTEKLTNIIQDQNKRLQALEKEKK